MELEEFVLIQADHRSQAQLPIPVKSAYGSADSLLCTQLSNLILGALFAPSMLCSVPRGY